MRGYFGIGIENTKTAMNIGTLLRSAFNFKAAFVFTVGKRYSRQSSDTLNTWKHLPLFNYETIEDLHIPHSCQLVGVEIAESAENIITFKHPERAIYLLGAEDSGLTKAAIKRCHKLIQIPTNRCLNVAVAGSIIMYDRAAKRAV